MTEEISNVHYIRCVDKDDLNYINNAEPRPRLWYRPEDMEYVGVHYAFRRKTPRPSGAVDGKSFTIKNLQMFHDHNMRSKEREEKRINYEYEELPKYEPNETTMLRRAIEGPPEHSG